ncbi:MAG: Arylsulfatase precursor [Bacteroidetes bacterium ADurb.Bin397]|nr:MAG: Arylsulfatase precursor [Bacteroidetes bacterium ADurb.Bin397]
MIRIKFFLLLIFISHMAQSQQNTILIIADDVGTDYFGVYSNSADTANTPNIRQFAENGILFRHSWANPVCSPTRAGIFTGRYSFRTGVGGVITSQQSPQLDTAEISIPELLKYHAPVSFATGCFGKWHLHNSSPQKYLYPNQMGYDAYSGNFNGAIPDFYNYVAVTNGIADTITTYATTQTVTDAINWLDTLQSGKPFFMWLAFNAPHTPFHKPPDTLHTVPGLIGTVAHINNNPKLYFKAALEAVDSEIGRLILFLQQNNLADSTNIIFIGDNGNDKRVAQIADTSHCKQTLYDYGVHVPMIITGPAVVNPGRTSNSLVNTTDLFSTILELSEFANWSNFIPPAFLPNDTQTLLPEIQNIGGSLRDWIFSEQFSSTPAYYDGKTIRNHSHQLIRFDNGTEEFYDMMADSLQQNNLLSGTLNTVDQSNYNFLCSELNNLLGTSGCSFTSLPNSVSMQEEIHVFPNPFDASITISIPSNAGNYSKVVISTISGQKVFEKINETGFSTIEIKSDLPSGIYFMEVITITGTFKKKICKL